MCVVKLEVELDRNQFNEADFLDFVTYRLHDPTKESQKICMIGCSLT